MQSVEAPTIQVPKMPVRIVPRQNQLHFFENNSQW